MDNQLYDYDIALSRAVTKPHVFDPDAACADLLAWAERNKSRPVDATEQERIDALHKAIAVISL